VSASEHRRGLLLASLGVAAIIPDATFVRLVDAPSLTNAMWRTGLLGISLSIFLAVRYRRALPALLVSLGRWGMIASVLSGLGTILFVVAVDHAPVANVLLILALSPFWAALWTRLVVGVTVARRTLVSMPFALVGVAVAVGASSDGVLAIGNIVALLCSLGLSANLTIIRVHKHLDMVPTTACGGFLGCAALALAGTDATLQAGDLAPLLLLGLVILPLAMALLTLGGRLLPSPETALLLTGETALSPLLAAWVIGESISGQAFVGGSVVLAVLVVHATLGLREVTATS
jgi:drug/metabolite transporter (DMT)-like permease